MKTKDFISALQDSKIIASQALGIITVVEDEPKRFLAGYLHNVKIIPTGDVSYPPLTEINFADYSQYIPKHDKILVRWIAGRSNYVTIHDKQDSVYSKKEKFENEMNRLMKKVETKNEFPIFIRDLSKLPWRQYE